MLVRSISVTEDSTAGASVASLTAGAVVGLSICTGCTVCVGAAAATVFTAVSGVSFCPQPVKVRAATQRAIKSAFFIIISS